MGVNHYTANTRAMPEMGNTDVAQSDLYLKATPPYLQCRLKQLSAIKPASETALVWDGNQTNLSPAATLHGLFWGAAHPTSRYMDKQGDASGGFYEDRTDAATSSTAFYYVRGLNPLRELKLVMCDYQKDFPNDSTSLLVGVRTRHVRNTRANLLFADGHVESKTKAECISRLFCVNEK
jgi:prepilin-type processing-associated H-X9-DG protein